jgi:hypothetical protein
LILSEYGPSVARTFDRNWVVFLFLVERRIENLLLYRAPPVALEIEQEIFFELLPRVDASWWEPGVPIFCGILERDDEGFGEGGFVPSGWGYGSFVAHEEYAGVRVSMVFR